MRLVTHLFAQNQLTLRSKSSFVLSFRSVLFSSISCFPLKWIRLFLERSQSVCKFTFDLNFEFLSARQRLVIITLGFHKLNKFQMDWMNPRNLSLSLSSNCFWSLAKRRLGRVRGAWPLRVLSITIMHIQQALLIVRDAAKWKISGLRVYGI